MVSKIMIEVFNPQDLLEIASEVLYQDAIRDSIKGKKDKDEELDVHWKAVFPEMVEFLNNQFGLFLLRDYVSKDMNRIAWRKTQEIAMPDVSQIEDTTLVVKALGRYEVLRIDWKSLHDYLENEFPEGKNAIEVTINPKQLFYDCAYQWWQVRLMAHYFNEVVTRVKDNNLRKQTFGALLGRPKEYKQLLNISRSIAYGLMPLSSDWEWEDAKNDAVSDWITKLHSKPFHEQIQKLGVTRKAIYGNLVDRIRNLKKQPEHISLDALEEEQDENHPPKIKVQLPSTQPEELIEPLTKQQISQFDELLGEKGRNILMYIRKHPEIIGTHGGKKEIAGALGYAQSTVGKYVGTNNQKGLFQLHAKKIAEIL